MNNSRGIILYNLAIPSYANLFPFFTMPDTDFDAVVEDTELLMPFPSEFSHLLRQLFVSSTVRKI